MISITININGKTPLILKRTECFFRGHEWVEYFSIGVGTHLNYRSPSYVACSRCDKRKGVANG